MIVESDALLVFKIFRAAEWAGALQKGIFAGSRDDQRDGYIHLSCAHQLAGTAARHFRGEQGLVLAAFDACALGPNLKWERSRADELFPHLYGPLPLAALRSSSTLSLGPDGVPGIPEHVARC
jgi:uncharacterized protein (DUF952 family)